MAQQVMNENKKKIMCKYCSTTAIHFDVNKKSKSGKLLPLQNDGLIHECAMSPWNQNKGKPQATTAAAQSKEQLVPIRQVELTLLTQKVDLVIKQLSALCTKYDVTFDNLAPVEHYRK